MGTNGEQRIVAGEVSQGDTVQQRNRFWGPFTVAFVQRAGTPWRQTLNITFTNGKRVLGVDPDAPFYRITNTIGE